MAKAVPAPRMSSQEREWRAQDDLRTLTAADAVRSDPRRMAAVKDHAQKQMATIKAVTRGGARKK